MVVLLNPVAICRDVEEAHQQCVGWFRVDENVYSSLARSSRRLDERLHCICLMWRYLLWAGRSLFPIQAFVAISASRDNHTFKRSTYDTAGFSRMPQSKSAVSSVKGNTSYSEPRYYSINHSNS